MGPCSSHERNVREPSGFAVRNMLWKTPVEYLCWPASYIKADTLNSAAFDVNGPAEQGSATRE